MEITRIDNNEQVSGGQPQGPTLTASPPTSGDVFSSTGETEAPVWKSMNQQAHKVDQTPDLEYNLETDPDILDEYKPLIRGVYRNKVHAMAIQEDLKAEKANREILSRAGIGTQIAASVAWQVLDPINLALNFITFGRVGVAKIGAKAATIVAAKAAAKTAAENMAAQALQEQALRASPTVKTAKESLIDIGAAGILGGMIGGIAAPIASRAAIKSQDILRNEARALAQAAIDDPELGGIRGGIGRWALSGSTATLLNSSIPEARVLADMIGHTQSTGGLKRTSFNDLDNLTTREMAYVLSETNDIFTEARKAGFNGSLDEFAVLLNDFINLRGDIGKVVEVDANIEKAMPFLKQAADLYNEQIYLKQHQRFVDMGHEIDEGLIGAYTMRVASREIDNPDVEMAGRTILKDWWEQKLADDNKKITLEHQEKVRELNENLKAREEVELKNNERLAALKRELEEAKAGKGIDLTKDEELGDLILKKRVLEDKIAKGTAKRPSIKDEIDDMVSKVDREAFDELNVADDVSVVGNMNLDESVQYLAYWRDRKSMAEAVKGRAMTDDMLRDRLYQIETDKTLTLEQILDAKRELWATYRSSPLGKGVRKTDVIKEANEWIRALEARVKELMGEKKYATPKQTLKELDDLIKAKMGPASEKIVAKLTAEIEAIVADGKITRKELASLNKELKAIAEQKLDLIPDEEIPARAKVYADNLIDNYRGVANSSPTTLGRNGSINQRSDVPYEVLRAAGLINTNAIENLMAYGHKSIRKLNLEEALGERLEGTLVDSTQFKRTIAAFTKAKEEALARGDTKALKELAKEEAKVRSAVADLDDEIFGIGSDGAAEFWMRMLQKTSAIAQLPLAALANVPETAAVAMVDGMAPALKTASSMIGDWATKEGREQLKELSYIGSAADVITRDFHFDHLGIGNPVNREYGFVFGKNAARTAETLLDKTYGKFMTASGTPFVNKHAKHVATRIMESKLLRLADDVNALSKEDIRWLNDISLTKEDLVKMKEYADLYGEGKVLNMSRWGAEADPELRAFVDKIRIAFSREVDVINQTNRVGETPKWARKFLGSRALAGLLWQYTRFMWHTWNNIVVRGFDRNVVNTVGVLGSMAAMAWAAQSVRNAVNDVDQTPEEQALAVARNYGPIAIPMMAYKFGDEVSSYFTDAPKYRTTTQNLKGLPLPAASYAASLIDLGSKAIHGKWKGEDTHNLARNFPLIGGFLNLPYIKPGTRSVVDAINETYGLETWDEIQDRKQNDKQRRLIKEEIEDLRKVPESQRHWTYTVE